MCGAAFLQLILDVALMYSNKRSGKYDRVSELECAEHCCHVCRFATEAHFEGTRLRRAVWLAICR